MFVWPDKAVLLLLDMYREREEDFSNGLKRSNKIWAEIAAQMKNFNPEYEVTSNQCATKMSGLKRTYKNIVDQNKKSGNHRSSWAFFSVMDSIFGNKASTRAPAIATSDGPSDPNIEGSSSSLSSITETPELKSPPRKRKRIEHVVEEFIERIKVEKEETREEMKRRETNQEKVREEKRKDREKRHNEQMEVQRSLISILQQFLNK
ncbi:uncharacterized protein LOC114930420 [Nylanderia fulva]|nr:uncharacterized protein LOC114930420 [Nylanderia fulva]